MISEVESKLVAIDREILAVKRSSARLKTLRLVLAIRFVKTVTIKASRRTMGAIKTHRFSGKRTQALQTTMQSLGMI